MAEMKQLREIAESYYEASSTEIKAKAKIFFESMDDDGDKKVDLEEFLSFMKSQGYTHMRKSSFFKVLDESGHGALSFMDVMTLYYIIKSRRPFCDSCDDFIPGIFFSCVQCFNASPKSAFDICHSCYRKKKYKHNHGGGALFLDNYTLLQATRHSSTDTTVISQPKTRVSRQSPREDVSPASLGRRHGKSPREEVSPASLVRRHGKSPREDVSPASLGRRHGKSPREDVSAVSTSNEFARNHMRNVFNKVVEQSQSDHRPPKQSASNYVSPSSRRRTQDSAPSTAIVPATRPKRSASKNVATPSDAITNYVSPSSHLRTQDSAPSTAIVPATRPPKGMWTEVASNAFKAMDKLIVVGNLVGIVVGAVSACTIM